MVFEASVLGLRVVDADNDTVLDLQLLQGLWTQAQYLTLTDYSRRLLEFTDGYIEVLPMPTDRSSFFCPAQAMPGRSPSRVPKRCFGR
jgi:hypothetical protein